MGGGYAQGRAAGVRETPLGIGCRDLISSLFCPMGSHLFPARPAPSPPSPQRLGGRSPARSGPIGRSPPASFLALLRRYFSRIPGLCIGFSGLDREPSGLDLDRRPSRKIRAPSAMSANVRLAAMQPQRSFLASPSAAWPGPAAPGPFPACPAPTSGLPGATAGLFPPLRGPYRTRSRCHQVQIRTYRLDHWRGLVGWYCSATDPCSGSQEGRRKGARRAWAVRPGGGRLFVSGVVEAVHKW